MKVRLFKILVFSFLMGSNLCYLESHANETIDDLREAYKAFRKYRKEAKKYKPIINAHDIGENVEVSVCASCPQISDLAGSINKTMIHMVENNQIDISEVGALEEIERLEAMYYLIQYDMENAKELPGNTPLEECSFYSLDVYLTKFEREPIANERMTEIFRFNVPLDDVNALHFRNKAEKGRYYFYRAKWPHHDKIIRVHVPANTKEATVAYLQLDQIPNMEDSQLLKKVERQKRKKRLQENTVPKEEPPKVYGMEYWGGLSRYKSDKSEWEAGFALAHKDNLPRRILLLKGRDEAEIMQNLKLNTEVEVSDRGQEVRLRLNYQGQDYLRLKGEADGDYRAEIPFELHIQEYALMTKGNVARTEDGEEAEVSLYHDGSSILHVRGKRGDDNSENLTIGNTYRNILGGTVSIDYQEKRNSQGQDGNTETLWLRYQTKF